MALAHTAATIGDAGGGEGAWHLATDLIYHDTFGLIAWSTSSLLVRPPSPAAFPASKLPATVPLCSFLASNPLPSCHTVAAQSLPALLFLPPARASTTH